MPHRNRVRQGEQHFCVWCSQNCILTQLSVVQAEGFLKNYFLQILICIQALWGTNAGRSAVAIFYCEHHHLITDQATSIYGC